jgi:hypothetical protein
MLYLTASIKLDNFVYIDEINHNIGDITTLFSTWMGEVFHMGGLAGLPFTGKTGFKAFSDHVPDGKLKILL